MSHKLIQLAAKMFERDEETAERERGFYCRQTMRSVMWETPPGLMSVSGPLALLGHSDR